MWCDGARPGVAPGMLRGSRGSLEAHLGSRSGCARNGALVHMSRALPGLSLAGAHCSPPLRSLRRTGYALFVRRHACIRGVHPPGPTHACEGRAGAGGGGPSPLAATDSWRCLTCRGACGQAIRTHTHTRPLPAASTVIEDGGQEAPDGQQRPREAGRSAQRCERCVHALSSTAGMVYHTQTGHGEVSRAGVMDGKAGKRCKPNITKAHVLCKQAAPRTTDRVG